MSIKFDIVIYHKGCQDGFASAYVAHKVLGNNAKYVPMSYYEKISFYKNKKILVCDFSFEEEIVKKLLKNKNSVYIIDHHKTAVEKLKNISKKHKLIDLSHSGAYLTWKYFYPKKKIPLFIKLIEDYDIWTFKHEETRPFNISVALLPYSFTRWEKLEDDDYVNKLVKKGKIIMIHQNNIITRECKKCKIKKQIINEKEYKIAYKNTTSCINEIGNELVKNKNCDFAVCYYYEDSTDSTKFSLRSIDEKTDVSEIAKIYGGGGHRNASGVTKKGLHNSI
jgi:uncharacterized protein